jgi:phosphohistidine swiveling domain-containing protein
MSERVPNVGETLDVEMRSPRDEPWVLELGSPAATLERVGGKGASLARLDAAGLPIPPGFHLTTDAYRRFVDENHLAASILLAAAEARPEVPATLDVAASRIRSMIEQGTIPADIAAELRTAYLTLGPGDPPVAVRSSASAEDLPGMSFAGQQDTYLNVRGGDPVVQAVKRCWASLWTARALGYRARQGIPSEDVALAVVIQRLVPAEMAGILFTANPLTGARDQLVINAAWGLGEAIVSGSVTPDSFVVDRQTGAVESQQIADKLLMTVRVATGTRDEPVPAKQRHQPTLHAGQAATLAQLGTRIEQLYDRPMDIEWAFADGRFFILQARPITALPEPRAVLDWTPPRARGRYFRASVIELLPDPLSPLFATLALPQWNHAMRDLMKRLGPTMTLPSHMYRLVTINDYAYYDFGLSAWQSALLMLGMLMRIRVIAADCIGRAQARWADEARPRYAQVAGLWAVRDLATPPAAELVRGTAEIVKAAADHYLVIQSGILPAAYMSEALFSLAYNRLAKRTDSPTALTFMLGFDSTPIRAEKSLFDLAQWARTQPELVAYVTRTPALEMFDAYLSASSSAPVSAVDPWREFCRRFTEHLNRFGHVVYDLDFAKNLAADDPTPLLDMLKYFLGGKARSPYERQSASATARDRAAQALLGRLGGLRRRLFKPLLAWAHRYAPLREDALADVGLGWPVVRSMMREVGQRLVTVQALLNRDDVFWLRLDEVDAAARALDTNQSVPGLLQLVADRRALSERERTVTPPVALPIKGGMRFLGIDFSHMAPARTGQSAGDTIKGQGASPGRVVGIARVIHGPGEFGQMQPGDILVAKITTPAWTPLFALAAGVVTDVGGPLSHGSIVAREYHVPAVLGTGVATERIRSGQRINVDGDTGVVMLDDM